MTLTRNRKAPTVMRRPPRYEKPFCPKCGSHLWTQSDGTGRVWDTCLTCHRHQLVERYQ